jgi:hypothetical protein
LGTFEVAVSVAGVPKHTVVGVTFNVGVGFTTTVIGDTTFPHAGVTTVNVYTPAPVELIFGTEGLNTVEVKPFGPTQL